MRIAAEWEPHERTLMAWPCRLELWGSTFDQARADYAATANAIAEFEPVTMVANPGEQAAQARAACASSIEIVTLPIDDSWMRDSGPIYVYRDGSERVAMHFRFNAWGGKFPPWDRDAAVGALIAKELGDEVVPVPMVLEGGSILTDGAGTLLTTEQCLLNPNRNPALDREAIEQLLGSHLGVERFVWLGQGLVEDRDTDGHIDLIAAFAPDGGVLLQLVDPRNPNFDHCQGNKARLQEAGIEVLEMPFLPYVHVAGERVAAGYMNFYICNGAVIVPVTGAETDEAALKVIGRAYPGREVVPVPGAVLAYGGGGPHCITQQVPA
jgi:agmatine deiminase